MGILKDKTDFVKQQKRKKLKYKENYLEQQKTFHMLSYKPGKSRMIYLKCWIKNTFSLISLIPYEVVELREGQEHFKTNKNWQHCDN